MSTNYIAVDSTCLFSQQRLLSCFNNAKDDVLVVMCHANDQSWFPQQILDFSIAVHHNYPKLGSPTAKELFGLESPVAKVVLKEKEKVSESLEFLKENGLVKIVQFEEQTEFLEPSRELYYGPRLTSYSESSGLGKMLGINRHGGIDPDRFPFLAKQLHHDVMHDLRMRPMKIPRNEQEELKTIIADIDTVAYAIANHIPYKSYNPRIDDGSLAKIMGHEKKELISYCKQIPESISKADLEEYLDNQEKYVEKQEGKSTELLCKLSVSATNTALNMLPGIGTFKAGAEGVIDAVEIIKEYQKKKEVAIVQSHLKIQPNPAAQSIIDLFDQYRMNPPKIARSYTD